MIPVTKLLRNETTVHDRKDIGPLIVWNMTPCCNLHCAHCYRDSSPSTQEEELSDEACIALIDEIRRLNPPIVLLSGGEPLLRHNIFTVIGTCKRVGLRVGLSTNGTLIDATMAARIKESRVDYVGVSIDGTEEFHDRFRGQSGAFRASMESLRLLNGAGVKTGVRFTLTKDNKDHLMPVLDLAIQNGVRRFCLYHLVYSGRAARERDVTPDDRRGIMQAFFKKARQLSQTQPEVEILTTDNHADGAFLALMGMAEERVQCHGGCSAGSKILYLDSNGTVYPCQFLLDEPLGTVKERGLAEIWHDADNAVLAALRNKSNMVKGQCGACQYKTICAGCRARAKAEFADLWGEDPSCYLTKEEIHHEEFVRPAF